MDRKNELIKVSIHGILANLLLVMFKAASRFYGEFDRRYAGCIE